MSTDERQTSDHNPVLKKQIFAVWDVVNNKHIVRYLEKSTAPTDEGKAHNPFTVPVLDTVQGKVITRYLQIVKTEDLPPSASTSADTQAVDKVKKKRVCQRKRMKKRIQIEASLKQQECGRSLDELKKELQEKYTETARCRKLGIGKPPITEADEGIQEYLKCSECYNFVAPQPYTCGRNHLVCFQCWKKLRIYNLNPPCPQCRDVHWKLAEDVQKFCDNFLFPCYEKNVPCEELLERSKMHEHWMHKHSADHQLLE